MVFFSFRSSGQLTTQRKYSIGLEGRLSQTLDLKSAGTLLILTNAYDYATIQFDSVTASTVLIRLDSNYDTLWVKRLPNFSSRNCILNSNNEIILVGGKVASTGLQTFSLGLQILKISLSGSILMSKYKFGSSNYTSNLNTIVRANILEYKPNSYIMTLSGNYFGISDKLDLNILKLNSNLDIVDIKKIIRDEINKIDFFIDNKIAKKGNTEFVVYYNNFSDFIYNLGTSLSNFLVIDTGLTNIQYKQLRSNDKIYIKSIIADDNNNLLIGGQMFSRKLIRNQFDTGDYINHFLTKVKFNNSISNFSKTLLFKVNFKAKQIQDKTYYYQYLGSTYVVNFSSGYYGSGSTQVHDSIIRNFRTTIFKIDSTLSIKWNKRLHVYGSSDTANFENNDITFNNGLSVIDNNLFFKADKIVSTSYQTNINSILTEQMKDELGFSITMIDTLGNNALCNATTTDILQKIDSLEFINLPVINFSQNGFQLENNTQLSLNIPLRKISNVCLPLKKAKSKFFWSAFNSNGFSTIVCKDAKLNIYDRSYNEPKTWHWIFPPQANISELDSLYLPDVQSIFNQAGIYPVKLVTTNDAGSDTSTQYITVINFIPQPNLGNDTLLCAGDTLKIIYQNPPNSLHYFNGPNGNTTSDTLLISESGQYEITAYTACGYLYDTINVNFADKPNANFGFATTCNNLNVVFTDSSLLNSNPSLTYTYAYKLALAPATTYTNFSSLANNNFTFVAYDSFDIRLVVKSNLSCVTNDTTVKRIILKAKPVAGFGYANNCGSLQVAFTSNATITAGSIALQQYFVGNTLIGTGANVNYNFASYGSYQINHVVKSNFGCVSDTLTQTVVVKDKPTLSLSILRDSVCANTNYTIAANAAVNASTITNYNWVKDNVLQPIAINQLTDNQPTGIYTYKVVTTSAQSCKSDTATKIITVASKPAASFSTTSTCGSKLINITSGATVINDNITSHYINYGDGTVVFMNPHNTTYTYANYGTYTLKYVAKGSVGCISDTAYSTVVVKDKPTLSIAYNNDACNNKIFTLTATAAVNASTITNYTWLKDGVVVLTNSNILTQNNAAGTYIYKLVATANTGCISDTVIQSVTVEKYPTTLFTAVSGCVGKNILLTNTSINNNILGAITYTWITSDGQTSNAVLPNFSFVTSGTKIIQLKTNTQNNCADSTSKTITIDDFPKANFNITEACLGKKITIENNSLGATNYAWQTSNGELSIATVPDFIFSTAGNYTISLTVATPNNCSDAINKSISIQAVKLFTKPAIDTNALVNQPMQLSITGASTYIWQPSVGNLQLSNSPTPIFTATQTGTYPLLIEGTTVGGCKGSASININVFAANNYVWIPNAFTPNGDGLNDKIKITCSGLQSLTNFTLYNRYGEIVYTQNTCNAKGWDGIFKGIAQPIGAFVYYWTGVDFRGKAVSGKGTVMLVR